jgi:hypothetical protein
MNANKSEKTRQQEIPKMAMQRERKRSNPLLYTMQLRQAFDLVILQVDRPMILSS